MFIITVIIILNKIYHKRCSIFLEQAASNILILTLQFRPIRLLEAVIKKKSLYRVTFITSWQPQDHSASQSESMTARHKALRAFTPGAAKSARGNINIGERTSRRLYQSILLHSDFITRILPLFVLCHELIVVITHIYTRTFQQE